jgi:iron complex outermembrane receptor protein
MSKINLLRFVSIPITCCSLIVCVDIQAQDIEVVSSATAGRQLKKLSIEELMNVEVISVSRRAEKLTATASAIQVITHEDIRRSGATSVPEALRLATNLQVAQVNSSQWAISARGFNNVLANKLLVMIDGRTVYTPLYAGVFWDVQNVLLEDVERIEVISGPGGTLWGANAVNGVINIITKNASHTQGVLIEGGVGTELQGYGGIRYGGKLSRDVYFRAYGTAFKRGSTLNIEGADAEDDWTAAQGGFQFDWENANEQLMLQANIYGNRPNPDGTVAVEANGHNLVGRWKHTLSENSNIKLQLYYDQTWRDFRNGFNEKLNTYDFDGQHRFVIGDRQEIVWGLGYRLMDHNVDNPALLKFLPDQKFLHLYNIFVQDRIDLIHDRLDLTLGSKFEHNSYTGLQFQPSVRLALTLTKNQTLWGAVSRAVRNPVRIDRDFYLYATPDLPIIVGNDNFKSEEVLAYELGWRLQSEGNFTLSLSTFYNLYDNLRTAEPGPAPLNLPITIGNGVEGDTYGAEFSGTYQPVSWWRLRGGYTWFKKELSIKPTSRDLNNGRVESNDPNHQFLIQSMIDLPGNIEIGFVVRYVDELPEPRVASYWGLDARLAWRPNEIIEFCIIGQNLLDDQHIEFIPSSPSPRNIEHSIFGKVVCRF